MKERPILFSAPMVRAVLDGSKTQTRRVVPEWQMPSKTSDGERFISVAQRDRRWGFGVFGDTEEECMANYKHDYRSCCPYGKPGEKLWVREAHAIVPRTAYAQSEGVHQVLRPDDDHDAAVFREGWDRSPPGRWRPSIHMPRWASRITLEITGVRVERLQDIGEEDARAEGCEKPDLPPGLSGVARGDYVADERTSFAILWNRINGPGAWGLNPWVWVVEFKRA